jgi:phospholipid/cholesterol/gamma-HCH transport system substrate-binding protein
MRQSKVVELWVGVFVALGLLGLFFLAMKVSNLADYESTDGYLVKAYFENVGSLKVRAPVSVSGVRVGRVSAISFDKKKYQALVEMRIDRQFDNLPEDTSASVLTAGLLGEQYIGLSPGGADDFLKEGSVLDLTQSAVVLEEMVSKFLYNKAEDGKKNGGAKDCAKPPCAGG